MSCLHTINRSPRHGLLELCTSVLSPGDALLFIEDGTYYCSQPGQIPNLAEEIQIYCLKEDMQARGTLNRNVIRNAPLDYSQFVDLCCEHEKIISWF